MLDSSLLLEWVKVVVLDRLSDRKEISFRRISALGRAWNSRFVDLATVAAVDSNFPGEGLVTYDYGANGDRRSRTYNGATTTLETLWMGIPLVTQVGEQFAARNSYAMLKNVGVEAGIAWSAEEYVGWGVRLGTDEVLRQQISWQLRQSRQTAPLWNARQFTRDLEQAFLVWTS